MYTFFSSRTKLDLEMFFLLPIIDEMKIYTQLNQFDTFQLYIKSNCILPFSIIDTYLSKYKLNLRFAFDMISLAFGLLHFVLSVLTFLKWQFSTKMKYLMILWWRGTFWNIDNDNSRIFQGLKLFKKIV